MNTKQEFLKLISDKTSVSFLSLSPLLDATLEESIAMLNNMTVNNRPCVSIVPKEKLLSDIVESWIFNTELVIDNPSVSFKGITISADLEANKNSLNELKNLRTIILV